mgnify:CR=1 FL=1
MALTLGLPVLLSTVAIAPATAAPGSTVAQVAQKNLDPSSYPDGRYIVLLAEKPAASYEGSTAGFPATKPATGKKLDAAKAEVRNYRAHLEKKQAEIAGQQGIEIQRQYSAAVNGFIQGKAEVVDGDVDHGAASTFALMDYERDEGKLLPCTACPRSDVPAWMMTGRRCGDGVALSGPGDR